MGDIISTESYMACDEFLETRFYKEWARPQHWVDGAAAVLEIAALLGVGRGDRSRSRREVGAGDTAER